ncbi:MAG: thiosulfate oxidation carrier protein SoxY [Sutterellaceae bacterium]|nr:thiosulfate oxidation carrier protein SoxY [Burkholderiaceae bacterium]MCX7902057.1 thiosulfate oxidation carrier protein SoxY [Burkholderiaceae bacterium]MDW8430059.1 thiosulfate oxidation carrier protein SoxY [Sutterellaceae bacterium]
MQVNNVYGRRQALRMVGGATLAAGALAVGAARPLYAQQTALGMPQPEEKVQDTLTRLFGNRPLQPAGDRIKLEAPTIAENGSVVPIKIDAKLPMTPDNYVKHLYVIADKNRRPLNAKFTLTPEAGAASIATNVRLAATSDVRVIAEMSNGQLYEVKQEVKVTVGGCGG